MEHKHATKTLVIANDTIKRIDGELEYLESELRRTEKDESAYKVEYMLKIELQISLLLRLKKANEEKLSLLKKIIEGK